MVVILDAHADRAVTVELLLVQLVLGVGVRYLNSA